MIEQIKNTTQLIRGFFRIIRHFMPCCIHQIAFDQMGNQTGHPLLNGSCPNDALLATTLIGLDHFFETSQLPLNPANTMQRFGVVFALQIVICMLNNFFSHNVLLSHRHTHRGISYSLFKPHHRLNAFLMCVNAVGLSARPKHEVCDSATFPN